MTSARGADSRSNKEWEDAHKKFCLSDKAQEFHLEPLFYCETDVKEFIQRLKDFIKEDLPSPYWNVCDEIDKLAGKKLVEAVKE